MGHMAGTITVTRLLPALALACAAGAQFTGKYVDGEGKPHDWRVNGENTLIWEGKPWLPIGPRMSAAEIGKLPLLGAAGLRSALITFPFDESLQPIVDTAEKANLTYLLSPGSPPPFCSGHYVMPQSYRVSNLKGPIDLKLRLPNCDSAFYVLADAETGETVKTGRANLEAGQLTIHEKPKRLATFVLLVYPHTPTGDLPDYWAGYDTWRDTLLVKLSSAKLGAGLRGLLDPLGQVEKWYDLSHRFLPDSPLFRLEFERYLRKTYSDMQRLNDQWRTAGKQFGSYREAAAAVPLFAEGRGVPFMWNAETDALTPAEMGGRYWKDYDAFLLGVALRRTTDLSASLRRIVNVPIVFSWQGWSPIGQGSSAAGQGIGVRGYGQGAAVAYTHGAPARGASLTWPVQPWFVATDVALSATGEGYGPQADPAKAIETLASLGAKGFFVRTALDEASLKTLAACADRIPTEEYRPRTLEFPETARGPADVLPLPGGVWWVPSPKVGARVDYGDDYEGYKLTTGLGTLVAIWSRSGPKEEFLHFADTSKVRMISYDGSPQPLKARRDGVTVTIGDLPTLFLVHDDLPVPDSSYMATRKFVERYIRGVDGPGFNWSDVKTEYERAVDGFSRNPGNAYAVMRGTFNKIAARVGFYVWLEGEKPLRTTFGYTPTSSAASDGKYLAVNTPFEPVDGAFTAAYSLNFSSDTSLRLLVAGRLPDGGTLHYEWSLDGGAYTAFNASPVSRYGGLFAWYDAGTLPLPRGKHTLTIAVRGEPGAYYDAAIDAILLCSPAFQPSGVRRPPIPQQSR